VRNISKYSITVPDATMFGIRVSGVKLDKNPFKILGEIILKSYKDNLPHFIVQSSDFPLCFPIGERYWSITHMFCTAMNHHISEYGHTSGWKTQDFINLSFSVGNANYGVFSKHKIEDDLWKVIIYSDENEILRIKIRELFDGQSDKVEFEH
jgi:hypothetical protein